MSATAAEILAQTGAMLTDTHVVYTSGRHGSAYVNKDAVYPHTERVAELCRQLAERARPYCPEVVCGPALGGLILASALAFIATRSALGGSSGDLGTPPPPNDDH